ncbi:16S rRNA (uracil(1498)-N(3))-methyltransferase [Ectobacillus sp. JY-23]|uniref:16S rRNA (uracil(1498)-N(3))-methyltransferase n=1 Tax=Ectobacillus sp. JY-23 TaxID=2933872 RepID=UPI001FF5E357|nr:16S rRNA (uracil(1498)-N(3))-methyltransferase [Ectobacillus sp. JY-23]UOY94056.1 16S rRNA (uracil(1498)-N(3))-methyltransferase [Ectobacillus sp. JY-23]
MQRYFVERIENEEVLLNGDDAHHIVKVMRMQPGDVLYCCANGKTALCTVAEITNEFVKAAVVQWVEESNELPVFVTIASGLPKGDKLELVLQKGTELGAAAFLPFQAKRSIVKWDSKKGDKKVERWTKIAKEAAEQSHRAVVPSVYAPVTFKELLAMSADYDICIVAYEEESKQGEKARFAGALERLQPGEKALLVFGPEGGLAEEEVTQLREANFIPCGLGPRILRTETAPLYALSAVSYHFELMR